MLRLSHITAAGILLFSFSAGILAEEINLPAKEVEAEEFSVQVPGRGMSMDMVQNRFGEAIEKYPAVGIPPITKWVYNNFTVYFESEYVIHAVINQ